MCPTFSVIIPTYGRPVFLDAALRSILEQSIDSFEVIVVDDASPEPVDVQTSSKVRLVRLEVNGGAAQARNIGARAARGEVLTFLDDDDTWSVDRLSMAAEGLERAQIAVCWQSTQGRRLEGHVYDTILDDTTPSMGAVALRRERWTPFDATYRSCEDLAWWLDTARANEVATVPRQGLHVRRHAGERTGYGTEQRIRDSFRLLDERAEYFDAHPRAAAFRFRRIGLMRSAMGLHRDARAAHLRAFRLDRNLRDVAHLARNLRRDADHD
jgi:hypothetical protein